MDEQNFIQTRNHSDSSRLIEAEDGSIAVEVKPVPSGIQIRIWDNGVKGERIVVVSRTAWQFLAEAVN